MVDIFGEQGPANTGVGSIYDYTASSHDVISATFDDAFNSNPANLLYRYGERKLGEFLDTSPTLDAETARTRVAEEGLTLKVPDSGIAENSLNQLINSKHAERKRQQVMARSAGGFGLSAAQFGAGLVASFGDPLNIASGFITLGGSAALTAATRGGVSLQALGSGAKTIAGKAVTGAAEGAIGAAAVEPLVYGLSQAEQADYTMTDSVLNLAFGTIMGGGMHMVQGAFQFSAAKRRAIANDVARQVESIPVEDRPQVFKVVLGQLLNDEKPDGSNIVGHINFNRDVRATENARASARGDTALIPQDVGVKITNRADAEVELAKVRADIEANTRSARGDIIENVGEVSRAVAESRNPQLFSRVAAVEKRIEHNRAILEDLKKSKAASPEIAKLEAELARTEADLARTKAKDKLRKKKLSTKAAEQRAAIAEAKAADTPDQKLVRDNLTELDKQRRDLGVEISDAVAQVKKTMKGGDTKRMSLELAQELNVELHAREIALEAELAGATQSDIAKGTYSSTHGIDLSSNEAITLHSNNRVAQARRTAQAAQQWQNKAWTDAAALEQMDLVLEDLNDMTPDEVSANTDDVVSSIKAEFGDDINLDEIDNFDVVDAEELKAGMAEAAACMEQL